MKTLLKIFLIVVCAIALLPLMPLLLVLGAVGFLCMMLIGPLLVRGALAVAGLGIAVISVMTLGLIVLAAVLSPVLIPVAVVVGLILWLKKPARQTA